MEKYWRQKSAKNEEEGKLCLKVAIAESEGEKQRIYRLRYRVYVEELHRRLVSVDHKNRLVFDVLDDWGRLLYAQIGTEMVGTVRLNIGTIDSFAPELVEMFQMHKFQMFYKKYKRQPKFSFSSKYVVARKYRRSQAAFLVIGKSYELCRREGGVQFSFAGCNPYMIPLYEKMGFQRFGENVEVPEYGCMVPLVVMPEGENHLRAVGSPFLRDARKRSNDETAARWFMQEFPAAGCFVNSRLVTEDELWLILCEKLGQSPRQAMPVLAGLTEEEAKKFLHIGVIHRYSKGERIFSPGDFAHEIHILLSGTLVISSPARNHPLETICIKPGDFCGRAALLESGEQTAEATAMTDVELFIVSGMAFMAFSCSQPAIARKVRDNIGLTAEKDEKQHVVR